MGLWQNSDQPHAFSRESCQEGGYSQPRRIAMGSGVTISGDRAYRIDPRTGITLGSVGGAGVIDAASDGDIIVLVYSTGRAQRHDAKNGSLRGSVGTYAVLRCSVSIGIIILRYANGKSAKHDAHTGGS